MFLLEQSSVRSPVAAKGTVPESRILAIVVVEGQVMDSMAGGTIDDGAVGDIFAVVDHDGPDVDKGKETDICPLLQREEDGI
jgi:hypothetical protein